MGIPEKEVIYGKSPISGSFYKITDYDRVDDERVVCKEKEEIEREDVPEEWINALEQ